MPECLTFSQGQTAMLTAQFVTLAGQPINVPDATVQIFGNGGSVVLGPTPMDLVVTGLYLYDYVIPNSLPVNTYTIQYTGTVQGTPTAGTAQLRVLPAGSPGTDITETETAAITALESYIGCAQKIPVVSELGTIDRTRTQVHFQWPRWNLSNTKIFLNNNLLTPDADNIAIDYDTGTVTFPRVLIPSDSVKATYNFRFFTREDLLRYLNDALSLINIEPGGSNNFTLQNIPAQAIGVLLHGAAANALQAIMFCLMFQKEATIFGGMDRASEVFSNFKSLKENHEQVFAEAKKKLKIARYPNTVSVVQPEFTLPGGRSRWFRYLFSSNI